ncbi:single-stranded DNA-binding protein [Streptomyces sp. N35]|uniref:single-stranded DNA-binding protein n=1 Tax=Streptomyces sp. N35 TaxID=2795730 RepID=UPI0018F434A6|nr:single-stranded DNA-binding protein [Streptomyces sp. N35]
MVPSVTHVSGTVAGDVEVRFTNSGVAVCRFRLTETPRSWNRATRKWQDGTLRYICTAWDDLATHATESLVDGVHVLATGTITEIRDNVVYLTADDLGVSLRQRIAYTEASLPSPQAARPVITPAPPAPAAVATPQGSGPAPAWWSKQRTAGWT